MSIFVHPARDANSCVLDLFCVCIYSQAHTSAYKRNANVSGDKQTMTPLFMFWVFSWLALSTENKEHIIRHQPIV